MRSTDTSVPCSISWRGGRPKIVPSTGLARRCGYGISGHPITMSRLPRLFAAPPTQARWTGERDPSGRACSDMQQSTRRAPNRLPRSSSARAGSTSVRSDLRDVCARRSGDYRSTPRGCNIRCSALTRPPGRHNRNGLPHGAAEASRRPRGRRSLHHRRRRPPGPEPSRSPRGKSQRPVPCTTERTSRIGSFVPCADISVMYLYYS